MNKETIFEYIKKMDNDSSYSEFDWFMNLIEKALSQNNNGLFHDRTINHSLYLIDQRWNQKFDLESIYYNQNILIDFYKNNLSDFDWSNQSIIFSLYLKLKTILEHQSFYFDVDETASVETLNDYLIELCQIISINLLLKENKEEICQKIKLFIENTDHNN